MKLIFMRVLKIHLIFVIIFLLFLSCSKNEDEGNDNSVDEIICIDSRFSSVLDIDLKPSCVIEDSESNILILGKSNYKITVIKLDTIGNLLWQKSYDQMYGLSMNIIEVNKDGYILISGRMHYESTMGDTINTVTVQEGFQLDSTNNYQPYFVTRNNYVPEYQTSLDNKIYVTKIDNDGNVVNQSSDIGSYTPGNIVQPIENDEFLLVVFQYRGDGAYQVYPWDPITFPKDKNFTIFHKLNDNGGCVYSNFIENTLVYETIDEIENNKIEFSVAVHGDQYVLNLPNETYLTDHYGFELDKYQPRFDFTGNHTFSMTEAGDGSNYYIGRTDFYNSESKYYLVKTDLVGNEIWYKEIEECEDARLTSAEDGFHAVISRNQNFFISKYNNEGDLVWEKSVEDQPDCFVSTCNGGLIYLIHMTQSNQLKIVKIDNEGNY